MRGPRTASSRSWRDSRTSTSGSCARTATPPRRTPEVRTMFREFLRFELRYQLRSPLPWLIALLLAFLVFLAISTDQVQIGGSIGNVNRNSPSVILNILGTFSV